MVYLEEKQNTYWVLASRNILVGQYCRCEIKSFGLLRLIDDTVYTFNGEANFPWSGQHLGQNFLKSINDRKLSLKEVNHNLEWESEVLI